jgi:hypothetical protein
MKSIDRSVNIFLSVKTDIEFDYEEVLLGQYSNKVQGLVALVLTEVQ